LENGYLSNGAEVRGKTFEKAGTSDFGFDKNAESYTTSPYGTKA